jgi:hypothetical protein
MGRGLFVPVSAIFAAFFHPVTGLAGYAPAVSFHQRLAFTAS